MKWLSRYFSVKRWIWKYIPKWLKKLIRAEYWKDAQGVLALKGTE